MAHDIETLNYHQVHADPTARISPNASIVGTITIGADCSIFAGASIRADAEFSFIKSRSNVQEGVLLHDDNGFPFIIGEGVTIGHGAILHGCEIGENCIIGMGSIIMNGARIGKNCIVGAGALITEGKCFEDNSLIYGSPARVHEAPPAEEMKKRCADLRDLYLKMGARMIEEGVLLNPKPGQTIFPD